VRGWGLRSAAVRGSAPAQGSWAAAQATPAATRAEPRTETAVSVGYLSSEFCANQATLAATSAMWRDGCLVCCLQCRVVRRQSRALFAVGTPALGA
jgi:hypothetical protein